jgi:putative NIF3 family GTP cyclohydrolase 1 type 2
MPSVHDIRIHFLKHASWVDPDRTCDQVLFGDRNKEVSTVGVGWYPSMENLQAAAQLNCDLFITHEPLFWAYNDPPDSRWNWREPSLTKIDFLNQTGMAVLREHDSWDNWRSIGIRDSWASFLGLDDFCEEDRTRWHAMYKINPTPLKDFAIHILKKIQSLGEDSIQILGDPQRIITRPSLGVGCGGPDMDMIERGSDCCIVCYDGASYWSTRERLHAAGAAVITLEHGTTEMPGIKNLALYVAQIFPELTVHYLDNHPRTWTISNRDIE